MNNIKHIPVLLDEVVKALHIKRDKKYIDATLGLGGHTREILKNGGKVLGIDDDQNMLDKAISSEALAKDDCLTTAHGNFRNIDTLAQKNGFTNVDGILFDLGISSIHLDTDNRGFSFKNKSQPLDMRLNSNLAVTAADLLNTLRKDQLMDLFQNALEYPAAKSITSKILKFRENKKFKLVGDFLECLGNFDPTVPIMALRIAVNTEYDNLKVALPKAFSLLATKGKLLVISFHSGEDKIVKKYFQSLIKDNLATGLSKKPIVPTSEEISLNPRARSAKLRGVIKK